MDDFLITEAEATAGLAREGMTLNDFDPTILGLVHDGAGWEVLEDSLPGEDDALEWARRAAGFGEHVGLFVWAGANAR